MRLATALCLGASASGCALPVAGEMDGIADLARFATHYDHVVGPRANLLDVALADCAEKTVEAETACVRHGIDAAHLPVQALVASVPGCRAGQICRYDQATRDRLGFVAASATDYVKHWRIELDFRRPPAQAAQVPVKVIDRDDFGAAPPPG